MRVMSNWAKKSDPAGHSWAVRMMDRASAVLNGESSTAQADALGEEAYVAKRMTETLATVYTTIIGDDEVDTDDGLNAIERVVRAAQVLRLEVDLYRAQADAPDDTHKFKNFHRRLCERFGYVHDEIDWRRDQVSLIEWIAKKADAPAEAREPIAWVTDDDRAITAAQKQRALADGGATASSVRPYSIPCYAVSAPADAGEAREPIGPHDLSTTAGGRSYVAEFFAKRLRRHDFGRYITGQLAADFACSLAAYLRDHDHAAADAGEAQPYAYVAPVSNYATRNKIVADRIGGLIPVYTAQPAARVASLTDAARDMLAERRRQVEAEGWTPKHDDEHDKGEMARAAACYALHAGSCFAWRADAYQSAKPHEGNPAAQDSLWPWDMQWWKPKDPRRDLVRAGALILAEIERLDRATLLNGADKS